MSLRLPISFALAWLVTVALFWSLHAMIGNPAEVGLLQALPKIDFVRLRRDSELEEKQRVKPQIEKPEPQPVAPSVTTAKAASVDPGADIAALAPSVDFTGSGGPAGGTGGGLAVGAGSDRSCIPQVRIQPDYPMQARQKKLEGFVDVQFTVASNGSVKDAVVLHASPEQIFDRAAVQAVSSWKYSPRIQDGRPAECVGTKVRIAFQLKD